MAKLATPAERAGVSSVNDLQRLTALTALNAAKGSSNEVTNRGGRIWVRLSREIDARKAQDARVSGQMAFGYPRPAGETGGLPWFGAAAPGRGRDGPETKTPVAA